jgi:DNA-binding response OmpR family regulator
MASTLKIVLVEDHEVLRLMLVNHLQSKAFEVTGIGSGLELDVLLNIQTPDLLILDINLPNETGFSIAQRIRRSYANNIDIIMLTAYGSETDRIKGYNSGADIYLTKPISVDELEASIRSISRRRQASQHNKTILFIHQIKMQIEFNLVNAEISRQELLILKALAQAPLQFLSAWALLECIGKETNPKTRAALDVAITRLRKKLVLLTGQDNVLKVARNSGYQLTIDAQISL